MSGIAEMRGEALRERLRRARLMLIFTPEACGGRDPLAQLARALPFLDVIQVRPKPLGLEGSGSEARATHEWTQRVLALVQERSTPDAEPLVIVNDRVDVAKALAPKGCAGVHLGQDDAPPSVARDVLGEDALVGWSTHTLPEIARAATEPVDYVGFGPFAATETKGYERGQGPERTWVASEACSVPVFPIGGIRPANAAELEPVGRCAVASSVLAAEAPGEVARGLRALVAKGDDGRLG